jgi:hypothetical protein
MSALDRAEEGAGPLEVIASVAFALIDVVYTRFPNHGRLVDIPASRSDA